MNRSQQSNRPGILGTIAVAVIAFAACANTAFADELKVTLSGAQEVPATLFSSKGGNRPAGLLPRESRLTSIS